MRRSAIAVGVLSTLLLGLLGISAARFDARGAIGATERIETAILPAPAVSATPSSRVRSTPASSSWAILVTVVILVAAFGVRAVARSTSANVQPNRGSVRRPRAPPLAPAI